MIVECKHCRTRNDDLIIDCDGYICHACSEKEDDIVSEYDSYSAVRDAIVEKRGWISLASGGRYIMLTRADIDDLICCHADDEVVSAALNVNYHMDATDTHQVIMTDKEE
jgi:hypothetical protein